MNRENIRGEGRMECAPPRDNQSGRNVRTTADPGMQDRLRNVVEKIMDEHREPLTRLADR